MKVLFPSMDSLPLCLVCWILAAGGTLAEPLRVAVIAEKPLLDQAAVLTAKLTEREDVEVVERGEIDAILQEQTLTAANLTAAQGLNLGGILRADAMLLLQMEPDRKRPMLTVLALRSGVILAASPLEKKTAGEETVEIFRSSLPKLRVPREQAIALSVVPAEASQTPLAGLGETFTRRFVLAMANVPAIFVLERQRMDLMLTETVIAGGSDRDFWKAANVVTVRVGPYALDPSKLVATFQLDRQGGAALEDWTVSAGSMEELVPAAAEALRKRLAGNAPAVTFDPARESAAFRARLNRLMRGGTAESEDAAAVLETATTLWALGERDNAVWQYVSLAPILRAGFPGWDTDALFDLCRDQPERLPALAAAMTEAFRGDMARLQARREGTMRKVGVDHRLYGGIYGAAGFVGFWSDQNKVRGADAGLTALRASADAHYQLNRGLVEKNEYIQVQGAGMALGAWFLRDFSAYMDEVEAVATAARTTNYRGALDGFRVSALGQLRDVRWLRPALQRLPREAVVPWLEKWLEGDDALLRFVAANWLLRSLPGAVEPGRIYRAIAGGMEMLLPFFAEESAISQDLRDNWGYELLEMDDHAGVKAVGEELHALTLRLLETIKKPGRAKVVSPESREVEAYAAVKAAEKRLAAPVLPEFQRQVRSRHPELMKDVAVEGRSRVVFSYHPIREGAHSEWRDQAPSVVDGPDIWFFVERWNAGDGEPAFELIRVRPGTEERENYVLPFLAGSAEAKEISRGRYRTLPGPELVYLMPEGGGSRGGLNICPVLERATGRWKVVKIPGGGEDQRLRDVSSLQSGGRAYLPIEITHPQRQVGMLVVDGRAEKWSFLPAPQIPGAERKDIVQVVDRARGEIVLFAMDITQGAFPAFSLAEGIWRWQPVTTLAAAMVDQGQRTATRNLVVNEAIDKVLRLDEATGEWELKLELPRRDAVVISRCAVTGAPSGSRFVPSKVTSGADRAAGENANAVFFTDRGLVLLTVRQRAVLYASWAELERVAMPFRPAWLDGYFELGELDETLARGRPVLGGRRATESVADTRGGTVLVQLNDRPRVYALWRGGWKPESWTPLDLPGEAQPRLTADGRSVAYVDGAGSLVLAALDGQGPARVVPLKAPPWARIALDARGEWLAAAHSDKVVVARLDGSERREIRLASRVGGIRNIAWEPAGTRVAVQVGGRISVVDRAHPATAATFMDGAAIFAWEAGADSLLVGVSEDQAAGRRPALMRFRPSGGAPEPVLPDFECSHLGPIPGSEADWWIQGNPQGGAWDTYRVDVRTGAFRRSGQGAMRLSPVPAAWPSR